MENPVGTYSDIVLSKALRKALKEKWKVDIDLAVYLSKQLLWQALVLASPIVIVALVCGLCVSVLQVITQIQDSTLNAAPKILSVVLMLMLCGGWMLGLMADFAKTIINHIPEALSS